MEGRAHAWLSYAASTDPVLSVGIIRRKVVQYSPDEHRRRDRAPRSRLAKEHIGSKSVRPSASENGRAPHSRHTTSIHTKREAWRQTIDASLTRVVVERDDKTL